MIKEFFTHFMNSNKFNEKNIDSLKPKSIAKNLQLLLKQKNLNVNQLAQCLGIPMMTIRRILSGETSDPRISTLKIIANYFNVSVDFLIEDNGNTILNSSLKIKTYSVPKLNWETINLHSLHNQNIETTEWQSVSMRETEILSDKTFALESRPCMYPRFPKGTTFIIDPDTKARDGDIILVKIKKNNDFTFRELLIDPPDLYLSSLTTNAQPIIFSEQEHQIIGVIVLTMLYSSKING